MKEINMLNMTERHSVLQNFLLYCFRMAETSKKKKVPQNYFFTDDYIDNK